MLAELDSDCICRHQSPENDEIEKRHKCTHSRTHIAHHFEHMMKWVRFYLLFNPLCKQSIALFSLLALWVVRHVLAPHTHTRSHHNSVNDDSRIAFSRQAGDLHCCALCRRQSSMHKCICLTCLGREGYREREIDRESERERFCV